MPRIAKKQQRQAHLIRLAGKIADAIEKRTGQRPNMLALAPIVSDLISRAESLCRRYENECSYEWADTEKYKLATIEAEEKLLNSVNRLGLFAYIQTDPRGGTLYVDSMPIDNKCYTNSIFVA